MKWAILHFQVKFDAWNYVQITHFDFFPRVKITQ